MKIITFPTILNKMETRADDSWKLIFETMGHITPEQIAHLTAMLKVPAHSILVKGNEDTLADALGSIDLNNLPELPRDDDTKSPSQRQRSVMFLYWKQQGFKEVFQVWYNKVMERNIEHYKELLV